MLHRVGFFTHKYGGSSLFVVYGSSDELTFDIIVLNL
jgi:hypothetical protein